MDSETENVVAESLVTSLPHEALPASAAVDALHLAVKLKHAFRSRLTTTAALTLVQQWAGKHGLAMSVDEDDFICVATNRELATRVLEVDRSPEPHELLLGSLLGYPPCCCAFVAQAGESNIDMLAEQIHRWQFEGDNRLIDPSGYLAGTSLICHLPCSPRCPQSLVIARSALQFITRHRRSTGFEQWNRWFLSNS